MVNRGTRLYEVYVESAGILDELFKNYPTEELEALSLAYGARADPGDETARAIQKQLEHLGREPQSDLLASARTMRAWLARETDTPIPEDSFFHLDAKELHPETEKSPQTEAPTSALRERLIQLSKRFNSMEGRITDLIKHPEGSDVFKGALTYLAERTRQLSRDAYTTQLPGIGTAAAAAAAAAANLAGTPTALPRQKNHPAL